MTTFEPLGHTKSISISDDCDVPQEGEVTVARISSYASFKITSPTLEEVGPDCQRVNRIVAESPCVGRIGEGIWSSSIQKFVRSEGKDAVVERAPGPIVQSVEDTFRTIFSAVM